MNYKKYIAIVGVLTCFLSSSVMGLNVSDEITELEQIKIEAHQTANQAREDNNQELMLQAQQVWIEANNKQYELKIQQNINESDIIMMAKTMWGEARGISSDTEVACIGWTILNRVDAGYGNTISEVITAPNQFYYKSSFPLEDRFYNLAKDVITRWYREKNGETNVGRVLPSNYLWYAGDGQHNWFRNAYRGGQRWYYSLPTPYNS